MCDPTGKLQNGDRYRKGHTSQTISNINNSICVMYWNCGGNLIHRIRVNPELILLLKIPEIFVFAETLVHKSIKSPIPDYHIIQHMAKKNTCRRGLAVFFTRKYRYIVTKDQFSKEFDIIWIRLKNRIGDKILCFFYAPGENHPIIIRTKFYDELRRGLEKYSDNSIFFLWEIQMLD